MELHIGKEIDRVLKEKGTTADWLAKKIASSRRNVYDILTREEINTGQLKLISEALDYDFFALYQPGSVAEKLEGYERKQRETVTVTIELDGLQTTLEKCIQKLTAINSVL